MNLTQRSDLSLSETFFQQSPAILVILDQAGRICALNHAAEQLFHTSAQTLINQPFTNILDPFSHQKAHLMIAETLTHGQVVEWELDHLQPNRTPVLVSYTTTLLEDDEGNTLGIGLTGHVMTNELNLMAQLATTNQELEGALLQLEKAHADLKGMQAQLVHSEKMRALGQMVAGVAHEINNPAAFVDNNLDYLTNLVPFIRRLFDAYAPMRSGATEEQLAQLVAIEQTPQIQHLWQDLGDLVKESQEGMRRIRNIVRSLRNFARLDEEETNLADISQGLQTTIHMVRPLCGDRINIVENIMNLPMIECNPGQMNQVFLNLLMNAIQSIEERGTIEVGCCWKEQQIEVTIRDTGKGMDSITLARLGEPFFTTKPVGEGTGLGLSICYRIIEQHRGSLRFTSQLAVGTCAIMTLPMAVHTV